MIYQSPINYQGSKYKMIRNNDLLSYFKVDENLDFIDVFGGSGVVSQNVVSSFKSVTLNEYNKNLHEIHCLLKENSPKEFQDKVEEIIDFYGLMENNYDSRNKKLYRQEYDDILKERFHQLRDDYNKNPNALLLYVSHLFSFSNQIKIKNNILKSVWGKGRGRYSNSTIKKIQNNNFKKLLLSNKSYQEIKVTKNDFLYLDPPYIGTSGYNESWNEDNEKEFLNWIDELISKEIPFCLSNLDTNVLLMDWFNERKDILNISYIEQFHGIAKKKKVKEILIRNYVS